MAGVVLLVLSSVFSCPAAVQVPDENRNDSQQPLYRSTVSEVRVTFFATDENNRAVETVTPSDFAVVDSEQVIRKFRSFMHSDETSLEVVALVDRSESTAPRFQIAVSDVKQLVDGERSMGNDDLSIMWFGGMQAALLCSNGCRDSDVAGDLLALPADSTTPLFDALIFATDFIEQHRRAGVRPIVVLFSDGNDNISIHSGREAMESLRAAGALVYSVDMGAPDNDASNETTGNETTGSGLLRQLSEGTGGRYFGAAPTFARRPSSGQSSLRRSLFRQSLSGQSFLSEAVASDGSSLMNAALNDLRASYVVTYDLPSHEVGFHSLRLLPTHNLNFTFHSRNGYNYEPGGP